MCDLVARTGRLQQRYEDGSRLEPGTVCFESTFGSFSYICVCVGSLWSSYFGP